MKTPHKHAECIKAWADGATIQIKNYGTREWLDFPNPTWGDEDIYRVKPGKEYPKSSLSYENLCDFIGEAYQIKTRTQTGENDFTIALRLCADAAVKRYIQDTEEQCTK